MTASSRGLSLDGVAQGQEASVAVASVGTVRRLAVVRLAVVADDLTGAADAAAPFAARGFTVSVALGEGLPDAAVVALSTDNRGRPADEARARTRRAVNRVREAELLFVKIDSTLRGQVRADVEGVDAHPAPWSRTADFRLAEQHYGSKVRGCWLLWVARIPLPGRRSLRLHGEVVAGLPLGELVMGSHRVPVVTKSGGFGAPDALNRAAEALEACP